MTCAKGRLLLTKLDMSRAPPEIRYSIRVHADMTWKAFVYSMELTTSQLTAGVPVLLSTTAGSKESTRLSGQWPYTCMREKQGWEISGAFELLGIQWQLQ